MIPNIHRLLLHILFVFFVASCSSGGDGAIEDNNTGDTSSDPTITPFSDLNADIYTGDTYDESEVSVDANGDEIIRTKLAILFTPSATKAEVDSLLNRINATVTAAIAGADSVSIRIPDPVTVDALEAIISDIESEVFVEVVLKSIVIKPSHTPDNIDVSNANHLKYIEHHAAVGGTAAWNAKEAISSSPNIIMMDSLGGGTSALTSNLDASLFGSVLSSATTPSDHGYHVAGIIAGSFDGTLTAGGNVTGMLPDHSNFHIIDLEYNISIHDSIVLALRTAGSISGTKVFNTSLQFKCEKWTFSDTCRERAEAMAKGIMWANNVRAAGLESKLFHAVSAGNRGSPTPDMRDTETKIHFTTAAMMTDMSTTLGLTPIPPLTNTMVVENLDSTGSPRRIKCLSNNSFVGGNISAIGTNVFSLDQSGGAISLSGTSMAAPQVAGLAAYMLAIDSTLTPQKIKEILINTAQPVPASSDAGCSDWATPAPAINAYAAVLALDDRSALSGSISKAPVRNAILDIAAGDPTKQDSNGSFDENDLAYYIDQINIGSQEIKDGTPKVKYSRADLNGDGYDGGTDGYKKKFNLDIDYPPKFTKVSQNIEGAIVEFNEMSLTDNDILCYYAYSDLYTGDKNQRRLLMQNRCKSAKMAVYYYHSNDIAFPGRDSSCGSTNEDDFDIRENISERPDLTGNNIPDRPDSHFWKAGESNIDTIAIDHATTRSVRDSNNNCQPPQSYYAYSGLDSTLKLSDTGNRLNIDITAQSQSDCWDMDTDTPIWECSTATTQTNWIAEFDFKISKATNVKLLLNFVCSGTNMSIPTIGVPTPPTDLTFAVVRLDSTGSSVPQHRDFSKWVDPQSSLYACNDNFPTIDIEQLIEFDEPLDKGTSDRVIISVTGKGGSFGHLGNAMSIIEPNIPTPAIGRESNTTTMKGYVELAPED